MNSDIIHQLEGNIGWKDIQLRHLGCNDNMARFLKLKSPGAIIGLTDIELPFHTDEMAAFHAEKDQLALQGHTLKFIHLFQNDIYFVIKKPTIDNKQQINGIIYHCQIIRDTEFYAKLIHNDKAYYATQKHIEYRVKPDTNICNLSNRELQCMFYILRGKTNAQIANALHLTKRTIDFYIENIKNKFGCHSKPELIIKAIEAGYMKIVP